MLVRYKKVTNGSGNQGKLSGLSVWVTDSCRPAVDTY
jgi:hypothetical protein